MARSVVFPFKVVRNGSEAVKPGSWFARLHEGSEPFWLEHGGGIEDWGYDTPLFVGREIYLNIPLLVSELDLEDSGAEFGLVHTVSISTLGFRKVIEKRRVAAAAEIVESFETKLDSHELSEELTLCTVLTLANDLDAIPPWAASQAGSQLWKDDTRILLEGFGSRFPMRDMSFSGQAKLPDNANWHLDWRPGLFHYSFNSAVTLLLNSDKPEFLRKMQEKDEILTEEVMGSIMAQICGYALADNNIFCDDADFPAGSLGGVARSWLLNALPGRSITEIRAEFERTPSSVHSALRALAASTL
jgi:hypothetical protein